MQNKLDMLFQPFRSIGKPNHMRIEYSLASAIIKQGSMVQRLAILPSSPGRIVEIEPSLEDMIVFTENSSGQSRITQARSDSSSSTSLKSYGIMHSAGAKKVANMGNRHP